VLYRHFSDYDLFGPAAETSRPLQASSIAGMPPVFGAIPHYCILIQDWSSIFLILT
jgi:hypothetical protein